MTPVRQRLVGLFIFSSADSLSQKNTTAERTNTPDTLSLPLSALNDREFFSENALEAKMGLKSSSI